MLDNFYSKFSHDIGIDLGTANTLVYVKGKGIVINEPSVVAVNQRTKQILAIGLEAQRMVGRTPPHIVATRPLVDGVISDFEITEAMLRYFIDKVHGGGFVLLRRPRVVIGIPSGVTEVEKRAVVDAAINAGARKAFLIEEPMAAAIGSRLNVQDPQGNMIVDIGGGTTEIAVISLGGIVISKSLRIAGDEMNENIMQYARENFNLLLGERTAEDVKIKVGSAYRLDKQLTAQMRGRDLVTGLPKEVTITDEQARQALMPSLRIIVNSIKDVIEEIPPELISDILDKGIVLAGGGSLLRGLDKLVGEVTAMPIHVSEDPLTCVVRGAGVVVEDLEILKDVLVSTEFEPAPK
ncbi:MAG: rod shape-determining protein [Candidatus Doudnabacteria bacterium CG10_big_fil_rev_8_21_14_0_10_42_18]|uniref:Cell shape-determining protein MreB n=1 Tax=Candidatus Doudnabacteria bacterium CG10_big_fil_rev_8_21_14_0_10_42_18 TaxID=1974552 RepID=A0A2H0VEB8_9BACT|nr:MAG: rod shape-determining protein [Candidatus Doudnabacteria bacterium CG10_big_fil_rev_8_21_14_0_10_42_18]